MRYIKYLLKLIEIVKAISTAKEVVSKVEAAPLTAKSLVEEINNDQGKYKNVGVSYNKAGLELNYKNTAIKWNPDNGDVRLDFRI